MTIAAVSIPVSSPAVETLISARDLSTGNVRHRAHRRTDVSNPCSMNTQPTANTLPEMAMSSDSVFYFVGSSKDDTIQQRNLANQGGLSTAAVGVNPRTLLISGTKLYGSGNVFNVNDGGVFAVTIGGAADWAFPGVGPSIGTVGSVALGPGTFLYFGSSVGPRMNRLDPTGTARLSSLTVGMVEATPAIGTGTIIYAPTISGVVHAFDSNLSELWRMPAVTGAVFDVSPTLDCARTAGGAVKAGPGTLYVVGKGSGAAYSIITDSKGLDPSAPWPKFQHDTRNTGSSLAPITDTGVCP